MMSGTSLDGLDLALCKITGSGYSTDLTLEAFETLPFRSAFLQDIREVFAKEEVSLSTLTILHAVIADEHAWLINAFLEKHRISPQSVDLIASHGQTVYHAPRSLHGREDWPNATLQLGEGDHLAIRTGITTVSDFRQKHVAAGGEGAPLAAYGDLLLLSSPDQGRALVNIGGIANITYLPPSDGNGEAMSSDVGPGNTIMDALARRSDPSLQYDRDAAIAKSGEISTDLLDALLEEPFFRVPLPKTTGPELFSPDWFDNIAKANGTKLSLADQMATLNRLSARGIADAIGKLPERTKVYLSGGGARNPELRRNLGELLPGRKIGSTGDLGIDPDAKEAILFAVLANELIAGDADTIRGRIKGAPPVTMGKISLPD
nr:anhydro-N-acetylmuramic acid kinase [Parvularcula mediterranea]